MHTCGAAIGRLHPPAVVSLAWHPHRFPTGQDSAVWEFDSWGVDLPAALRLLAAEVGGDAVAPGVNCGGVFARPRRPPLPSGKLTAAALCQAVAALQPPGARLPPCLL